MKQVLQHLSDGRTEVAEVPQPAAAAGCLLISTSRSLVSAGTERMLVEFGKAGWIDKARQQPDKVRMVLDKVRADGLGPTVDAVRNKLDQPLPMGYCNAGRVIGIGPGVSGFTVGDRVASNGRHAEVVKVPVNLCARIPDVVSDEEAAFTVMGAIALQGIRLIAPTLGESVVVTGLGLVGLMAVQLFRAHGCRVLGIDSNAERLALASRFGAETVDIGRGQDPVAAAEAFSRGRGVDAVLIAASTRSDEPVAQAARMCRKRGRIVLVGVTGLSLSRADFYEKELTFQVSCSYGPGRYDTGYEEKGHDYPVGFVRWTEQRNFEAVLDMMADGRLDVKPLISHRFTIEKAGDAYALVGRDDPSLGILIEYPGVDGERVPSVARGAASAFGSVRPVETGTASVGFVGAGSYASAILMPAFRDTGAQLRAVVSDGGVSAAQAKRKYGFESCSTDSGDVFADAGLNAVVVATRHDSHARLTIEALAAGKHVFVEKPLCIRQDELESIERALENVGIEEIQPLLMVGFNRRFAPQVVRMRELLSSLREPRSMVMTVNAGILPANHWTLDPDVGGGRLVGEGCHFVDLLRHLAGSSITSYARHGDDSASGVGATLHLGFADGSTGTIHYFTRGHRGFPKERLDVFCGGRALQLDNYRRLRGYGWERFSRMNLWRQDKGQSACVAAFVQAVREGGPAPIPIGEILEVSRVTLALAQPVSG